MKTVSEIEKSLARMVERGTHLSVQKEEYGKCFDIEIFLHTRKIKSYKRNGGAIDVAIGLEGFHVLAR